MRLFASALTIAVLVLGVASAGCYDDPFLPRAPYYDYRITVTGLDGYSTENGSAVLRLPVPAIGGEPVLEDGWWPNSPLNYSEVRHGTRWVKPEDTPYGPMLALEINETDYYYSYARVTPVAVSPGQNESELPAVVPDRISKAPSFDDFCVVASGSVAQLDQPTSAAGREAVVEFLNSPLLPATRLGDGDYTSYVYVDEGLKPDGAGTISISATLTVCLNHNKVNASEEGLRRFEYHAYTINASIPAGSTGYLPVRVHYSYSTGL